MNIKEQSHLELFALLADHFERGDKNAKIRWQYPDGITVTVTDYNNMTTQKVHFKRAMLTDDFLSASRAQYAEIMELEFS